MECCQVLLIARHRPTEHFSRHCKSNPRFGVKNCLSLKLCRKNNKLFLKKTGQTFWLLGLLWAHRWRLWPETVPGLRLLANTSHCLRTLSLSLPYPLYFSIHIPFWGEILHYFCFVLGCLLSLSLLTRGNKRNKQKQEISCLAATDIGLAALQRGRHLRLNGRECCYSEPD